MLELGLLGSIYLKDAEGGEIIPILSQPKRLALLAYLALSPSGPFTRRDTLLPLFWPESDDAHARNTLSQSLSFLRQHLPADAIISRGTEEIGFAPSVLRADTELFQAAVNEERWKEALDLYRGDFLPAFHVGGAWGFEDWAENCRASFRRDAGKAAWALAQKQIHEGKPGEAEVAAARALELAWADEVPVREFLQSLARTGKRVVALRFYEEFCHRLKSELDLEPSEAIKEVAEAIRNGDLGSGAALMKPVSMTDSDPLPGADRPLPMHPNRLFNPSEWALWQVAVAYLFGSLVLLGGVGTVTDLLGLPFWVAQWAGIICLAGLPMVMGAAVYESRTAGEVKAAGGHVHSRLERWLNWRTVGLTLGLSFGLLTTCTTGYMGMRTMGIGPPGTLVASGVLEEEEPLVLADFATHTVDSTLVLTVTDAFRVTLSQSRTVKILEKSSVADLLILTERDRNAPLDLEVAREVAVRLGLRAVIAGEIDAVGSGFVLSARLMTAESGEELAGFREEAGDPDAIIPAIDRLAGALRERVGESLKSVRRTPPLQRVRTASLEALKLYDQGLRAVNRGDSQRGITLLSEAIALDSLFGAAYSVRGGAYNNIFIGAKGRVDAIRAYELRDRRTARGRTSATAGYYAYVRAEYEKAVEAIEAYREVHPEVVFPLNNLAVYYMFLRQNAQAEEVFQYIFKVLPRTTAVVWYNLVATQFNQGKLEEADETLRRWKGEMPGNLGLLQGRAFQATALWDYPRASAYLDTMEMDGNAHRRSVASEYRAAMAGAEGRVREAERYFQDGFWTGYDQLEWSSNFRLFFFEDSIAAVRQMREGLTTLDSLPPDEADPLRAAVFFARAGRPDLAREQVDSWERVADEHRRSRDRVARRAAEGLLALAEGRPDEAIPHLRYANRHARINPLEYLYDLGQAYRLAGRPDSARVQYERYLETPYFYRAWNDGIWLPVVYRELASLLEEEGEARAAAEYYQRFVDLWQEADPELQPRVRAAREAVERLGGR